MPNWEVTIRQTEEYYFDKITADTEDEANQIAWDLMETPTGKGEHHHDSDSSIEAFEKEG